MSRRAGVPGHDRRMCHRVFDSARSGHTASSVACKCPCLWWPRTSHPAASGQALVSRAVAEPRQGQLADASRVAARTSVLTVSIFSPIWTSLYGRQAQFSASSIDPAAHSLGCMRDSFRCHSLVDAQPNSRPPQPAMDQTVLQPRLIELAVTQSAPQLPASQGVISSFRAYRAVPSHLQTPELVQDLSLPLALVSPSKSIVTSSASNRMAASSGNNFVEVCASN